MTCDRKALHLSQLRQSGSVERKVHFHRDVHGETQDSL